MTASPRPTVVAPSPTPTHPDVAGGRANRNGLDERSGHWSRDNDRGRGDYSWDRNRNSQVNADLHARMGGGDCQGCQGQNCEDLFHSLYRFDGASGRDPGYKPVLVL